MLLPATGSTIILVPEPTEAPPHEPVSHCQFAPVPKLPPTTDNVFEIPLHVLLFAIEILVAAVEALFTVTALFVVSTPQGLLVDVATTVKLPVTTLTTPVLTFIVAPPDKIE